MQGTCILHTVWKSSPQNSHILVLSRILPCFLWQNLGENPKAPVAESRRLENRLWVVSRKDEPSGAQSGAHHPPVGTVNSPVTAASADSGYPLPNIC